jgi:archaemetzincin
MTIWYGLPIQSLPVVDSRSISLHARRVHPTWRVPQVLTGYVLNNVLVPYRRRNAVATLALASTDLWPGEGWNFVFGQASLTDRVGVWSLARFGDPETEWPVVLRRTIQVAMHETGHMLGILHCTRFECGMNGSNSLPESDHAPLPFCSECETKVCWACGLDPAARTTALRDFFKKEGLEREWTEYERRLKALSSK